MELLRRYTDLTALIDLLINRRVGVFGYQSWVDANDRRAMNIWQSTLHYGFAGALCLTESSETFHHWQVFANGPAGVCIVFDKEKLKAMFSKQGPLGLHSYFIANPVEYVRMDKVASLDATDIHRLPFLKRVGFRDEREFRIIGYQVEEGISAMYVPLDPSAILKVIFTPFAHPTLVKSCKAALKSLDGWERLRIEHSRLTDNQTWQKALLNFPKRHGMIYTPWADLKFANEDES
jgi:hypothetical protein